MSLSDVEEILAISQGSPPDQQVALVLEKLGGRLPKELRKPLTWPTTGLRTLAAVAVHGYRVHELAMSASELAPTRVIACLTLIRSTAESAAVLCRIGEQLNALQEGKIDPEAYAEFLDRIMMGSRVDNDEDSWRALNILGLIDHADKKFAGFRKGYDLLCEYTHPNFAGALHTYTSGGKDDRFDRRSSSHAISDDQVFTMLATYLKSAAIAYFTSLAMLREDGWVKRSEFRFAWR